ncbi:MAG TPA: hypothetical protein VES63_00075 [Candidatus Acidoferrum sp.]|nr:hypothetical protein [Candidatus Acidoferrum sp.]
MLSQNVSATVPLIQIMLSGTTNNQNCENNCIISQTVNVQKGTAVEWMNNDLVPHTLVSGEPGDTDNGTLFDTGPIWVGKFFIHDFNDVGVYHYFERDHPQNTGIINVTDWTYPKLLSEIMTGSNVRSSLESPLKQFKSGVAANNVICRSNMQLLIQNQENLPICAKLGSVSSLLHRDWSYPIDCKYVHGSFTAGEEGLVMIENNASNQFSGKSYSPQNSTVVIGWNNTVSWINQDGAPSSVTSDWNLFDSGPILPGADWQHDFECAGNYGYHSDPHPWMKGWIRVLPPSG